MSFWTLVLVVLVALFIWSCRSILLAAIVILGGFIVLIIKYIGKAIISLFRKKKGA